MIPLTQFPEYRPYTNIQPFTIRDNATYLSQLETLIVWIKKELIPHLNTEVAELVASWESNSNALVAQVQEIADGVGTSVEDAQAAQLAAESARDLAEMYASAAAEIQDTAITTIFNDIASAFRQAADGIYLTSSDLADYVTNSDLAPVSNSVSDLETLTSEGRLSEAGLNSLYPVYLVWTGTEYPPRVPGAVNIFFGPFDPGLLMEPTDFWANSNVTTIAEVVAAAQDTSSSLYAAIQTATVGSYVNIPLTLRSGDTAPFVKVGTTELYGFEFAANKALRVGGTVKIPFGWNSARVRVYYTHLSGSGNVRFARSASAYRSGATPRNFADVTNTATVGAAGVVNSGLITGDLDLTMMENISVSLARSGTSDLDTLEQPVYILGVGLEKTA